MNTQFTRKERQILKFVYQDKCIKQIANETYTSPRTVKYHLGNIYKKLGVNRRSELPLSIKEVICAENNTGLQMDQIKRYNPELVNAPTNWKNAEIKLLQATMVESECGEWIKASDIDTIKHLIDVMSKTKHLKEIIKDDTPFPAPRKTTRNGEHYEFLVGLGDDETAVITMTKDGYEWLRGEG